MAKTANSDIRRFRGWTVLTGLMLVSFSGAGSLLYSFGVFLPSICEEMGWSRTTLAGAFTLSNLLVGLLGPIVGASIAIFGPRSNIIFANLLAAVGLAGMYLTEYVWHAYLFYGVLIGLGLGFGLFLPCTALANIWFIKRKPLAIAISVSASGAGGFVLPPLIAWMISIMGWRDTWLALAALHLVLAVVIGGLITIRDKPKVQELVPDEVVPEMTKGTPSQTVQPPGVYQEQLEWKPRHAMRQRATWLLIILGGANNFTVGVLAAHQVAYLQDIGFSAILAATALGLISATSIIGRLGLGALAIKYDLRYLAAFSFAMQAIGMVVLLSTQELTMIYLYTVLIGISSGALTVAEPAFVAEYYGVTHYSQIMGWMRCFIFIIGGIGAPLSGVIYDTTGTYTLAFIITALLSLIGALCAFLAKPPKPSTSLVLSKL